MKSEKSSDNSGERESDTGTQHNPKNLDHFCLFGVRGWLNFSNGEDQGRGFDTGSSSG